MRYALFLILLLCGCETTPPPSVAWTTPTAAQEQEYEPYLKGGTNMLTGQAFMVQRGGAVVYAAGRQVTLNPATSIGDEWWEKAGRTWTYREWDHPSPAFKRAQRTTTADAEGRFRFTGLAAGRYYVQTSVTWVIPQGPIQGGTVGRLVEVPGDVILNEMAR